ncbi:MAG: chemotaxis protein CheW [Desulfarculaceae bacterium]|nr:chemotaxis protein CheW [Desulfarculaceae bacterium]
MGQPSSYEQQQLPWVILRLGSHRLALSAAWVREMAALPEVTALPGAEPHLRGMVDIRGRVMPLMDLRRRLGLASLSHEADELIRELQQQEQAHQQWLEQLEDAVLQGRAQTAEADPGQCPFGLWLNRRRAEGGVLARCLEILESPHRQAHLAAVQDDKASRSLARAHSGAVSSLSRAVERCRRDLRRPQKEIALVMQHQGSPLALAVDEVEAVEPLEPSGVNWGRADLGQLNQRLVSGVAQRPESGEMVFLLELDQLLEEGRRLATPDQLRIQ